MTDIDQKITAAKQWLGDRWLLAKPIKRKRARRRPRYHTVRQ
jgi:hypothetical protein